MSETNPLKVLQDNLRGITLMIAAMAMFAVEDAIIKLVAKDISVGQILFILAVAGFAAFASIAKLQGIPLFTKALLQKPLIFRNLGDVTGAMFFVPALTLMPLSNVSAILQTSPLLVVIGAAIFLRESVGWRRWSAVLIGLIGVLIIIRPGAEGFNAASILAIIGVIGLSVRDLATRSIKLNLSTMVISASAYMTLIIPAFCLMMYMGGWQSMNFGANAYMVAACIIGPISYYAITLATRIGEISVIAPFRYSRLIFAIILGYFLFGEVPDYWMLLGSSMVISTGVYSIYRERQVTRKIKQLHGKTLP